MLMTVYRAVLIDLDGTLLDGQGVLSSRSIEALKTADRHGIRVIISTGRSVAGALPVYNSLGIENPIVCFNGLVIYEPATGRLLSCIRLPDDALKSLVDWADEYSEFFYVTSDKYCMTIARPLEEQKRINRLIENVESLSELPVRRLKSIVKIQCFCTEKGMENLCRLIECCPWSDILRTRPFPLQTIPSLSDMPFCYVDIEPDSREKAEAVFFLSDRYDIRAEEVIAIGDQINDVPMISAAGLGVAVHNASDEAKRAADIIIGANSEDGVARFIESLVAEGGRVCPRAGIADPTIRLESDPAEKRGRSENENQQ